MAMKRMKWLSKKFKTYSWSLDALPIKLSLPHRRSPLNSSRSLSRPKLKTIVFCSQMLRTTSMLGHLTFKKLLVVRKFSLWLSHSTCTAPFHTQLKGLPKSLITPVWSDASSSPTKRSSWSSTTSTTTSCERFHVLGKKGGVTKLGIFRIATN